MQVFGDEVQSDEWGALFRRSDDWLSFTGLPEPGWEQGPQTAVSLTEGEWDDLSFLEPASSKLRQLIVRGTVRDFSAIERLHSLERLILDPYDHDRITLDLGQLPKLRDLSILGSVSLEVPVGHKLRDLAVDGIQAGLAGSLTHFSSLDCLSLARAKTLPREYPPSLRRLEISLMKGWDRTVETLRGLRSLRELFLDSVRGMSDLAAFREVECLERLYAEECDELVSVDGPQLAPDAQYLFVGRTPLRKTMPERWTVPTMRTYREPVDDDEEAED